MNSLPRPAWNKTSPHEFGVWTMGEAVFMRELLQRVGKEFGYVRFLEIGVAEGATMCGLFERCQEYGIPFSYEGVDGLCGTPSHLPERCKFTQGDSAEVFPKVGFVDVQGESKEAPFNILLVDGSHNNNYVILDFCNYAPKVMLGGYIIFHDSNPGWQFSHYQGTGPDISEFRIAVRMGLQKLGLLDGRRTDFRFVKELREGTMQGMFVIKRIAAF